MCQKSITPALVQIWVKDLSDIPGKLLCPALEQLRKTWTSGFLPTPGNVRALIDQADAGGLQIEAEEAWRIWRNHVDRHYHPDLGWDRNTPQLSAIAEHSARAAGGAYWTATCPESELQWARKRFIESYTLAHETGQVQHLLTRGESKRILASLTCEAAPKTKTLPSPPGSAPTSAPIPQDDSIAAAFDHARVEINSPRPMPSPLSSEEVELRKREQLARFEQYLQKHPELRGNVAMTEEASVLECTR